MTDEIMKIGYINHRGKFGVRRIFPTGVRYGITPYHTTPQWLLDCFDFDKKAPRTYALTDLVQVPQVRPEDLGDYLALTEDHKRSEGVTPPWVQVFGRGKRTNKAPDIFEDVAGVYAKREAEGRDLSTGVIPPAAPVADAFPEKPNITVLSGPQTHICWTPDSTPPEQRIDVVLVPHDELSRLAGYVYGRAPAPEPVTPEIIPSGVGFDAAIGNFVRLSNGVAYTSEFYDKWYARKHEFPDYADWVKHYKGDKL
jgi:hypothetical protein